MYASYKQDQAGCICTPAFWFETRHRYLKGPMFEHEAACSKPAFADGQRCCLRWNGMHCVQNCSKPPRGKPFEMHPNNHKLRGCGSPSSTRYFSVSVTWKGTTTCMVQVQRFKECCLRVSDLGCEYEFVSKPWAAISSNRSYFKKLHSALRHHPTADPQRLN